MNQPAAPTFVVATAGHVDHGKSAMIRALTGTDPDRWAEEQRRGLTIDLGFAFTTLPSGRIVNFVDVPGHQRFLPNTLAGLGPAPVVCFVIAADSGWQQQSSDHRDTVAALGISRGVIVISRSDLAPDSAAAVLARAREELAGTGLADAPAVTISAKTGQGLDTLIDTLDAVLAGAPAADPGADVRWWVDRSFSISGAGTVVTGTLAAGQIHTGDHLVIGQTPVVVRGLQSRGQPTDQATGVDRVAVNVRGISHHDVKRGDALLTPDAFCATDLLDVHLTGHARSEPATPPLPSTLREVTVHLGTAAIPARLRPLDADYARLRLTRPLPVRVGDRIVLRDGAATIHGGVVLDVAPRPLTRRGDARRRAALLADPSCPDAQWQVRQRGAVRVDQLRRWGTVATEAARPASIRSVGDWWVDRDVWRTWATAVREAVDGEFHRDPAARGLSVGAAARLVTTSDAALLAAVIGDAGVEQRDGYLRPAGTHGNVGTADAGITALERHLQANPFAAPDADDLAALSLSGNDLAAAERAGRIIRIGAVVLLPSAPELARDALSTLSQPFTASQARTLWATTRRVAIPLLEHLDSLGLTRRVDADRRIVLDGPP